MDRETRRAVKALFAITIQFILGLCMLAGKFVYAIIIRTKTIGSMQTEDLARYGLLLGIFNIFVQMMVFMFSISMVFFFASTILIGCLWIGGMILTLVMFHIFCFGITNFSHSWIIYMLSILENNNLILVNDVGRN